jgi:hypothetical protein
MVLQSKTDEASSSLFFASLQGLQAAIKKDLPGRITHGSQLKADIFP